MSPCSPGHLCHENFQYKQPHCQAVTVWELPKLNEVVTWNVNFPSAFVLTIGKHLSIQSNEIENIQWATKRNSNILFLRLARVLYTVPGYTWILLLKAKTRLLTFHSQIVIQLFTKIQRKPSIEQKALKCKALLGIWASWSIKTSWHVKPSKSRTNPEFTHVCVQISSTTQALNFVQSVNRIRLNNGMLGIR